MRARLRAPLPFQLTHSSVVSAGVCALPSPDRTSHYCDCVGHLTCSAPTLPPQLWTMSDFSPQSPLVAVHLQNCWITTLVILIYSELILEIRLQRRNYGNIASDRFTKNLSILILPQWNTLLTKPGNIIRVTLCKTKPKLTTNVGYGCAIKNNWFLQHSVK